MCKPIDFDEVEQQLLERLGFSDDDGVLAENQVKIFDFMEWFKEEYQ